MRCGLAALAREVGAAGPGSTIWSWLVDVASVWTMHSGFCHAHHFLDHAQWFPAQLCPQWHGDLCSEAVPSVADSCPHDKEHPE